MPIGYLVSVLGAALFTLTVLAVADGDLDGPGGALSVGLAALAMGESIRFEAVVDAIEAFTAWVRSRAQQP
jgi:hypothetical protein